MSAQPPTVVLLPKHHRKMVRTGLLVEGAMGKSVVVSSAAFANTRCTVQRLSNAKIFHGWVESFDEREIAVRINTSLQGAESEIFQFQVFGLENEASFRASMTTQLSGSLASIDPDAHVANLVLFQVQGEVRNSKSDGTARLANQGVMVMLKDASGDLTHSPVEALDVSIKGLAAALEITVPKDTVVHVAATTLLGQVEMSAIVRYARPVGGSSNLIRHGLEIQEMHRIDQLRWAQMFKQGL